MMRIYEIFATVLGQDGSSDSRKLGSFTEEAEAKSAIAWIIEVTGMTAEGGWEHSPDFPGVAVLTCRAPRFSAIWAAQGADGKQGEPAVLGADYLTREAARSACQQHAGTGLSWHPVPSQPGMEGAEHTQAAGNLHRYAVMEPPFSVGAPVSFALKTIDVSADAVRAFASAERLPVPPPKASKPAANIRRGKEQLYIVQSGRSSVLHLILSKTPSTPNPMSPGSIAAQLLWFGGTGKMTLCGRPATRPVSDVFRAEEATCRECKRRAGLA